MTRLISLSRGAISRIATINKSHLQCRRTLYSSQTHQQFQEQFLEIDHSVASIRSISSNPFFSLLGICRNLSSLKKIHALLVVHGLTSDLLFQTKLVSLYGSYAQIKSARLVFDKIPNPDNYSCKVMIRWYFLNDLYSELIEFYICLRKCLREHDNIVFSIVLKACSELCDFDEGRKAHCQIVKVGSPDSFVLTGLVDMYAKCGEVECSREVFDEIDDRNVVSWTSMIVGYVQNNCAEEGLMLFNQMRDRLCEGNQYTFASIVTACTKLGALHQGKWVHGFVIKKGIDLDSFSGTPLVDMYVKCGAIGDARSLFDELHTFDLVSWTAMIVGYTQNGYPDEALKLFIDKRWAGILANTVTAASVLSACAQSGNSKLGRSVHSVGIKLGIADDHTVTNALVDMYAKCRMIEDARFLFETVSVKNLVTWNSIISGYFQNGSAYEAVKLFHQMRSVHLVPDAITVVTLLSACASLGALSDGSSLHAYSLKQGLPSSSVYIGTAFVNFYAKCGDPESARMVFDGMIEKNRITWSAMIGGYGMQGDCSGSLALFNDMLKEKLEPNDVIFMSILSACSHTGMVGEGLKYFDSMCQQYNFVPSMKHYVCMVDLLARAGRLDEAWDFIENMPMEPDVSLFGAFLNGCNLHLRFDLGEAAAKKMIELHPDDACYYVLMCNLYTSSGRWNQANQVRELMKRRGLIKSPGRSQVEMDIFDDFSPPRVASLA
ncbi:pentatricopeptide repeat-containing protein At2g03380, mitochondrial [Actinidia eriantha]|uniref:pentatricopeptide repeat-containing protein At2g03380, mitochondrial n=1 Tax=Actinidia eriantha TaxID=165200 RepID=UPI0025881727|nr:pentatricopeptide repeat-containing protein At2g03380, mitochondrial [Actinidia eriantha]